MKALENNHCGGLVDAAGEHRWPTASFGAAPVTRSMSNSDAEKVTVPSEWYASDPKDTKPR